MNICNRAQRNKTTINPPVISKCPIVWISEGKIQLHLYDSQFTTSDVKTKTCHYLMQLPKGFLFTAHVKVYHFAYINISSDSYIYIYVYTQVQSYFSRTLSDPIRKQNDVLVKVHITFLAYLTQLILLTNQLFPFAVPRLCRWAPKYNVILDRALLVYTAQESAQHVCFSYGGWNCLLRIHKIYLHFEYLMMFSLPR